MRSARPAQSQLIWPTMVGEILVCDGLLDDAMAVADRPPPTAAPIAKATSLLPAPHSLGNEPGVQYLAWRSSHRQSFQARPRSVMHCSWRWRPRARVVVLRMGAPWSVVGTGCC